MAKVIINGLQPTSAVPTYFNLVPSLGVTSDINNREMMKFQMYERAEVLPQALGRSQLMIIKPLKPIETLTKVIRRPPVADTLGMQPSTGIGRGESKGLAYNPRHPTNTPLMPLSSNFTASLNNKLGQPK